MKERILEFLKKENKTSSQFAEEIGVQPSSVSHIISGRNKPSLDFIIKMLQQYEDLCTDWLIFGKGDMYKEEKPENLFDEFHENQASQSSDTIPFSNNTQSAEALTEQGHEPLSHLSPSPSSAASSKKEQSTSSISQVILIYSDNTFRSYNS